MPVNVSKERNWYKVATIILAVATLTVTFVSGVYLKRVDQRNQRVAEIERKLQTVQERREKLKDTPRVEIELLTLSASGLPETAFQSLKEVPAVVRIKHHSGLTAKGITVLVESSDLILRLLPNVSADRYEAQLSSDARFLTIDIAQLRPQSTIDITVMCAGATRFTATTRIAEGLVYEPLNKQPKANDLVLTSDPEYLDKLDPNSLNSDEDITRALDSLGLFLKVEREKPLFIGDLGSTGSFILTVFGPAAVWILILIVLSYSRGRRANERGNKIGRAHSQNLITAGTPKDVVRQVLGEPDKITLTSDGADSHEEWLYEPAYSRFFGWQPDARVNFKGDNVASIEFKEYGERVYS